MDRAKPPPPWPRPERRPQAEWSGLSVEDMAKAFRCTAEALNKAGTIPPPGPTLKNARLDRDLRSRNAVFRFSDGSTYCVPEDVLAGGPGIIMASNSRLSERQVAEMAEFFESATGLGKIKVIASTTRADAVEEILDVHGYTAERLRHVGVHRRGQAGQPRHGGAAQLQPPQAVLREATPSKPATAPQKRRDPGKPRRDPGLHNVDKSGKLRRESKRPSRTWAAVKGLLWLVGTAGSAVTLYQLLAP